MNEVRGEVTGEKILVHLSGRIDSGNAREAEREIAELETESAQDGFWNDVQHSQQVQYDKHNPSYILYI